MNSVVPISCGREQRDRKKSSFTCYLSNKVSYVAKQIEGSFCHVGGLKSLANFTLTIDCVGKFITSSSSGVLELGKKFSYIRKVINPLQIFEFIHTIGVKEKRENFQKEGVIKKTSRVFLAGSAAADTISLISWLGNFSIGTATLRLFGVVVKISVFSIKNTCVVVGCFLGLVDASLRVGKICHAYFHHKESVGARHVFQVLLAMAANVGKVACIIFAGPQITVAFLALSIGTGIIVILKLLVDNHVKIKDAERRIPLHA